MQHALLLGSACQCFGLCDQPTGGSAHDSRLVPSTKDAAEVGSCHLSCNEFSCRCGNSVWTIGWIVCTGSFASFVGAALNARAALAQLCVLQRTQRTSALEAALFRGPNAPAHFSSPAEAEIWREHLIKKYTVNKKSSNMRSKIFWRTEAGNITNCTNVRPIAQDKSSWKHKFHTAFYCFSVALPRLSSRKSDASGSPAFLKTVSSYGSTTSKAGCYQVNLRRQPWSCQRPSKSEVPLPLFARIYSYVRVATSNPIPTTEFWIFWLPKVQSWSANTRPLKYIICHCNHSQSHRVLYQNAAGDMVQMIVP